MLRANYLTRQSREVILQMDRRLRAQGASRQATKENFTEEVAPGWTLKDEQEFNREGGRT